ncbi:MAG: type II toxin-antitoxin system prevent-host-death family antitoxin [Actinomycetota bacterium]
MSWHDPHDSGARTVGVRELRSDLADAVRRAQEGERTVVTTRGRPVAQLGPLDADAPDLERLLGSGALVPPRRDGGWRPPEPIPVFAGVRIDQVLRELRG